MAVHHVEMQSIDAGALELAYDAIEIAEIGGRDACGDLHVAAHGDVGY
jgi:hypothetical protein